MSHNYINFCPSFLTCPDLKNTLENLDLISINYFHKRDFHLQHKYLVFNQAWSFIKRHVRGVTIIDTISGYDSDQDQSQRLQKPVS